MCKLYNPTVTAHADPFCPYTCATLPAFLRVPMPEREHIQLPQIATYVPTGRSIH